MTPPGTSSVNAISAGQLYLSVRRVHVARPTGCNSRAVSVWLAVCLGYESRACASAIIDAAALCEPRAPAPAPGRHLGHYVQASGNTVMDSQRPILALQNDPDNIAKASQSQPFVNRINRRQPTIPSAHAMYRMYT
ncbi:hypothetical protein V9T40_010642 [Parthenolecanium corni]|uniref:Uncharacterized protein n=1 Tax=Parthenolecanium corni TaxID=536013 RepID=A0AAN9TIE0_9HEMI